MEPSPSPSDIFGNQEDALQQWIAKREAGWEATAVRRLLKALNLTSAPYLTRLAKEREPEAPGPTFAAFREVYYNFPFVLVARRIPYVHQVTLLDLDRRFTKTVIYRAWQEVLEQTPGAPVMVFPWPEVGTMVLRTGLPDFSVPGLVVARVFADKETVVLEDLERFADTVLTGLAWEPPALA